MRGRWHVSLLAGLLLWVLGTSCQPGLCYYCGAYYNEGESFLTFDKCNTCTCEKQKTTGLGIVRCQTVNQCAGFCYFGDNKYSSSAVIREEGVCRVCDCAADNIRKFETCGGITFCRSTKPCPPSVSRIK
ncbi:MAG: hypothetical protein EP343_23645 [Deltaproteobacteria bacterium]|nr:MAG: hypothetical protein EP343_23645 [Deltaproteobacteria bacterium]